ncbi:small metal-binding protein SmbP [Candidatus Nitrospira salsa]|nr:MAG: hypothetical protein NPIRA01_00430 [Nitrospirales bacterium]
MKDFTISHRSIMIVSMLTLSFSFSGLALGASPHTINNHSSFLILTTLTSQDKLQQYKEDVEQQLKKAQNLLQDIESRIDTRSKENQETLKRKMMKLNKELEHAQRVYKNFDSVDPKDWLRDKTEVDAVMANLDMAYDEILPTLHDKSRYLQEAVHHAKLAESFAEEERKNLFLKNSEKAKDYASLAQQEGIDSEPLSESISELNDAIAHINQDKLGAAKTLIRGAYLHLNSAFKEQKDSQ